ncbi:MAG: TadE family type IV pilus minor pilin [Candidatus Nanopelagicales bacterium]
MVTAELAVALPALAAVAVAVAWMLSLGTSQMTLAQAAREGARAAARGDAASQVRDVVVGLVPGASVDVSRQGRRVVVTAELDRVPPLRFLDPLGQTLRASATSWSEDW